MIYPFGGNASQCRAVENALTNQMSVIQGPPGTGKTQTILNIIANLILQGKTVAVVSSNNSATKNVYDKLNLPENNLGFIAASLGSTENKKGFIENQVSLYPDFSSCVTAILRDADALLKEIGTDYEDSGEFQLLVRCLSEQTVTGDGTRRLRIGKDEGLSGSMKQRERIAPARKRGRPRKEAPGVVEAGAEAETAGGGEDDGQQTDAG